MRDHPNPADGAPDRRARRKLEVRGRLLEAARAPFEEKGFGATTVDEICASADVAQGDGWGPEKTRRLHAAFHALLADGAAVGDPRATAGSARESR